MNQKEYQQALTQYYTEKLNALSKPEYYIAYAMHVLVKHPATSRKIFNRISWSAFLIPLLILACWRNSTQIDWLIFPNRASLWFFGTVLFALYLRANFDRLKLGLAYDRPPFVVTTGDEQAVAHDERWAKRWLALVSALVIAYTIGGISYSEIPIMGGAFKALGYNETGIVLCLLIYFFYQKLLLALAAMERLTGGLRTKLHLYLEPRTVEDSLSSFWDGLLPLSLGMIALAILLTDLFY